MKSLDTTFASTVWSSNIMDRMAMVCPLVLRKTTMNQDAVTVRLQTRTCLPGGSLISVTQQEIQRANLGDKQQSLIELHDSSNVMTRMQISLFRTSSKITRKDRITGKQSKKKKLSALVSIKSSSRWAYRSVSSLTDRWPGFIWQCNKCYGESTSSNPGYKGSQQQIPAWRVNRLEIW